MRKIELRNHNEVAKPDWIKALIVEFITTFLFVFVCVGSAMATDSLIGNTLVGLFAVAVAHELVVLVMISAGHISGGHLNPAVTLGLLLGGHVRFFRAVLYVIDQLLASSAACVLLSYLTGGMGTPVHTLSNCQRCCGSVKMVLNSALVDSRSTRSPFDMNITRKLEAGAFSPDLPSSPYQSSSRSGEICFSGGAPSTQTLAKCGYSRVWFMGMFFVLIGYGSFVPICCTNFSMFWRCLSSPLGFYF